MDDHSEIDSETEVLDELILGQNIEQTSAVSIPQNKEWIPELMPQK